MNNAPAIDDSSPSKKPGSRWSFAASTVMQRTAALPSDQRSSLLWLDDHARTNNLSLKEVAKLLGYDHTYVFKALVGPRNARLDAFVAEINKLKSKPVRRLIPSGIPFVETSQAKKIWAYCDAAQSYHRIGFIYGLTQIGKSEPLIEYAHRQNSEQHKKCIYIEMPSGGHKGLFVRKLSSALGFSSAGRGASEQLAITGAFTPDMLLIVDEFQRCFRGPKPRVETIDFIREIFNESKCAIMLCGTHEAEEGIEATGATRRIFDQLRMRGLPKMILRATATQLDLARFAKVVGLNDPAEAGTPERRLQDDIVQKDALGFWLMHLQMACKTAQNANRPIRWSDVLNADKVFRSLSKTEDDK